MTWAACMFETLSLPGMASEGICGPLLPPPYVLLLGARALRGSSALQAHGLRPLPCFRLRAPRNMPPPGHMFLADIYAENLAVARVDAPRRRWGGRNVLNKLGEVAGGQAAVRLRLPAAVL